MAAHGEFLGPMLTVAALILAVLVVLRQMLTAFENRTLTGNLADRIEELSEREHQLRHQAFHDSLTGLANRALFLDRVEHALTLRSHRRLALLFLDIDDFKLVNDSLGHSAGDELITAVGQRLRAVSRHGDTVARLGGDEFGILIEGLARRQDAEIVAGRLLDAVRSPLTIDGVCLNTRASIGVAHTEEARSAGELLRNADIALYSAKGEGKGSWKVFATAMQEQARDKLDLEAELARAVDAGEIDVAFQPMVRLDTGELAGFEALARWSHGRRGAISPMTFIGLAEEMGLIHRLGVAVLRRACEQARVWTDRYPDAPDWWMTVNLSARQLSQPGLVEEVLDILVDTGLAPNRLVFEITETSLLSDAEVVLTRLHELRDHGIRLALDDFGTGYASLDYLRRLPVDVLKIDRIFVDAASNDPSSARLLQAVVNIGATLGLETLAEGVEDPGQASLLTAMRCDLAQGYHFARPGTVMEIERLFARISADGWRFDQGEESRPPAAWDPALPSSRDSTG
jgi:diguanylate cyclase (GGDEF)-like protein